MKTSLFGDLKKYELVLFQHFSLISLVYIGYFCEFFNENRLSFMNLEEYEKVRARTVPAPPFIHYYREPKFFK